MNLVLPSRRVIGEGENPFIIAEIGSNWKTLDDISVSIQAVKNAGADAVKFQLYDYKSLYGLPEYDFVGHSELDPPFKNTIPGTLNPDWLPKMKSQCDELGIEFMCSAFSPELYEIVNPFVNIHKVASAEMTHVRILEKVKSFGKSVILSTGASGGLDIVNALRVLENTPKILMYCVASYPAQEINLTNILAMQKTFNVLVGYSDHSLDVSVIPYQAVLSGACVIEKHVTAFPGLDTPDRPHSLTIPQFKKMVDVIHNGQHPSIGWIAEENEMISKHNRRLIAIKDIKPGDQFKEGENFGIYRSLKIDTKALSPFLLDKVNGTTAKTNVIAGDGIGPGDI